MAPLTQNQADKASYGALLAEAATATATAHEASSRPFHDPQVAADVVIDYERFLAIGGRHLKLLLAPPDTRASGLRRAHRDFAHWLATLAMERRGDNPWAEAGDSLGLAHDVLATHVSTNGQLLSPDADSLTERGVQAAAFARVAGLLETSLSRAQELLTNARSVQPPREPALSRNRSARLRQHVTSAQLSLRSAPLLPVIDGGTLVALDELGPTISRIGHGDPSTSGLSALRALRQLSYSQGHGDESANTHTLTDLCKLAVLTCHAAQGHLPLAHTPLDRVHRANALDMLAVAESAWSDLGRRLFPHVQGLTKAPHLYREAIVAIAEDATAQPAVTTAVLAALPRLATDAGRTVSTLYSRGELVSCDHRPGQLGRRWQPVEAKHAQRLIDGFGRAANASRAANDAWHRSADLAPAPRRRSDMPVAPARRLSLGVTS